MRTILFITIILSSCKIKPDYSFFAIKGVDIYSFDSSITINEFKIKADSLKCEGYNIVAKSTAISEPNKDDFIIKSTCKSPKQLKFVHPDGIELPIYECDGFRTYGINLCEDDDSNFELLREFYLNPKRKSDYPFNPKNATVKFVVDQTMSIESLLPLIKRIKSMRNKIGEERLTNQPFLLSIETLGKDSILIKPLKIVN